MTLRSLLEWQRTLARWPRAAWGPDGTPFVSLYAAGRVRGCYGVDEGAPGERLARAFVRASEDTRFGGVRPTERGGLSAQASYFIESRRFDPAHIERDIEAGVDGIGLVRGNVAPVVLLPQVACDGRLGPTDLVSTLLRKAGIEGELTEAHQPFAFRTDDVAAWMRPTRQRPGDACDLAARWLASLVGADGRVAFAVDARVGVVHERGAMFHGRSAVVVRALRASGRQSRVASAASRRLAREIAGGLSGAAPEGWPTEAPLVAGTLAMAAMAGIDVRASLVELARSDALVGSPWHGAQVVAALGRDAPERLWRSCVEDLERRAWAPWTCLAARARGDASVLEKTTGTLIASVRKAPPHAGGAGTLPIPEIALTALTVEALAPSTARDARAAVRRAREFLGTWQLVPGRIPAALDPKLATGAFVASPIVDALRGDITAHALLALLG